jgi:hypothetical protein
MASSEQILSVSQQFHSTTGVRITGHAQKLIYDVLEGITADPHPRWRVSPEELAGLRHQIASDLPSLLAKIMVDEHVEEVVTE